MATPKEKAAKKRELPKKENDLYRSIAKFYETKQYKKGIKVRHTHTHKLMFDSGHTFYVSSRRPHSPMRCPSSALTRHPQSADAVLKKFPDHGETQAMKGLCLNCLGDEKKDEARELVKLALRNDMMSHVCWHVHGLLHRSDKDYAQAVKAYKQALKIDPGNMLILRDSSLLQVQMRDLEGFCETRRRILVEKPNQKSHWMAFAVAHHLAGRPAMAFDLLSQFQKTLEDGSASAGRTKDYEESELVLYKAQLLVEDGKHAEALTHLEKEQDWCVDVLGRKTEAATLLLRLGRFEEAQAAWRELLTGSYSAENYGTHRGWQAALLELAGADLEAVLGLKALDLVPAAVELTAAQRATLVASYASLAADRPRSRAVKRIPLTFLDGPAFDAALEAYMRAQLADGVPALAADLSALFASRCAAGESGSGTTVSGADPVCGRFGSSHPRSTSSQPADGRPLLVRLKEPRQVAAHPVFAKVHALASGFLANVQGHGSLDAKTADAAGAAAAVAATSPQAELWCRYLLAQLEEGRGDLEAALAHIEAAIAHTPTAVDLYERRARLLKKSGDAEGASLQMEVARKLDLQDRYINNKSTKYLLRLGKRAEALATIGLFTKHDGDPSHNIKEMQVLWVANEFGAAALRSGEYGPALKSFLQVEKTFDEFTDDQFDFHSYCLRKMTLRSYVGCLQMSSRQPHHVSYQRAACGAIACYLDLFDNPSLAKPPKVDGEVTDEELAAMSPAERKAAKAKAKRAKEKAAKRAEDEAAAKAKAAAAEAAADAAGGKEKKKSKFGDPPAAIADPDPNGAAHLAVPPLPEAHRLVTALLKFAPAALTTHAAAFDVACRRGKPLVALKAMLAAHKLDRSDPALFLRAAAFAVGVGLGASAATAAAAAASSASSGSGAGGGSSAAGERKGAAVCRGAVAVAVAALARGAPARAALDAELATLVPGGDAFAFVDAFAAAHAGRSLPHALAAARATLLLAPLMAAKQASSAGARAAGMVTAGGLDRDGCSVGACSEAHALLVDECGEPKAAASWHALCAAKYPKSAAFGTLARPVVGDTEPAPDAAE